MSKKRSATSGEKSEAYGLPGDAVVKLREIASGVGGDGGVDAAVAEASGVRVGGDSGVGWWAGLNRRSEMEAREVVALARV